MEQQPTLWQFMQQQHAKLLNQTVTHIGLTFLSLLIAIIIALPLGIWITRQRKAAGVVLGIAGILQTIPSIALLGFMIPLFGIGAFPAITALFLYALLPIIRNTYTGINEVNPSVVDAAKGMGMSNQQILFKVQLPLAMPVILAGIRTATVINVGVATLAAYIAAGGLGEFIFGGIALNNTNMILAGAIPAALLAIIFDLLLSRLQRIKAKSLHTMVWLLPIIFIVLSSFYIIPSINNKFVAGFTPEFMGREDGYLGLISKYKLSVPTVVISDAVMYKAAYEKKLDVISGYSTDGRLKAYNLYTLIDDKKIFPPYYAAPVVREEVLQQHPKIAMAINMLSGKINDSIMTELNYRTDYLHQTPEKVAADFLKSIHLYKSPQQQLNGTVRLGSKIFGEQYILLSMYKTLIEAYAGIHVETKTGLGGTLICFNALTNNQIDMYPEYTGTALLAILNADKQTVQQLNSNPQKVYDFVSNAFNKKYHLAWLQPIGFNNAYALMMRKQQAEALHISTISDLKRYLSNSTQ